MVPAGRLDGVRLSDRTGRIEPEIEIFVNRAHQIRHFVFKEVVGPLDFVMMDGDVALRAQLIDQFLDSCRRHNLIRRALDQDTR